MTTIPDLFIEAPGNDDYPELVLVWEAAVRATHHFLAEADIQFFKPLILNEYLAAVRLTCVRIDDRIAGFCGTSEDKIEMLFVHPDFTGKGIGKQLLLHAVHQQQKKLVDVNEQNEQAVGFYQYMGFKIKGRSATDTMGKPYPILHLELEQ